MKRITRIQFYSVYDTAEIKNNLEQMAQQGWILEKSNGIFWKYQKNKPQQLCYAISFCERTDVPNGNSSKAEQNIQRPCDDSGWHAVCATKNYQIFCNEKYNADTDFIQPELEIQCIENIWKKYLTIRIVMMMICAVQIGVQGMYLAMNPLAAMADSVRICSALCHIFLFAFIIGDILKYENWHRKAKAAAKQNRSPSQVQRHNSWYFRLAAIALCMGVLAGMGAYRPELVPVCSLGFLGLLTAGFLRDSIKILLNKGKFATGARCVAAFTGNILAAVCLIALMTSCISNNVQKDRRELADRLVLSVSDLTESWEEPERSYHRDCVSLLLGNYTGMETVDGKWIYYDIMDASFPWVASICETRILCANEERSNRAGEENSYYMYENIDAGIWHADAAWRAIQSGEPTGTYLFRYGKCLICMEFSWEVTSQQAQRFYEVLLSRKLAIRKSTEVQKPPYFSISFSSGQNRQGNHHGSEPHGQ